MNQIIPCTTNPHVLNNNERRSTRSTTDTGNTHGTMNMICVGLAEHFASKLAFAGKSTHAYIAMATSIVTSISEKNPTARLR